MGSIEYQKQHLDSDQNFYDQPPFKEALEKARDVLDSGKIYPGFHMGVLRRSLTLIARNPRRLHKFLPSNASEDLVISWMTAGREMLTSRFISSAKLPAKAPELRQALRALGEELRDIPDWIGYINGHLNPDHYTTDGMPRTRFKAFSSATSYQYLADLKKHKFELFELNGIDRMIADYWDKNPEE